MSKALTAILLMGVLAGCGEYSQQPECERWEMKVTRQMVDGDWDVQFYEFCVIKMQKLPAPLDAG